MKPEKLTFIGLKSYSEQVEIDFSLLTKDGLFGIFGSTGSGKSTILDAIFLALYGYFPESNVSAADFINKKTGYVSVEFTFSVRSGETNEKYLVKREYKAKGDKKTTPQPKGTIYKIDGESLFALSENATQTTQKVEEILGLKMEQFVKCIVLPQGQFSAFLSLNRGERLRMVSGLFDLDKFGYKLQEKIKIDLSKISDEESVLAGQLLAYEDYTSDSLKTCKEALAEAKKEYIISNEKLQKIEEKLNDYKKNYETRNLTQQKRKELETLDKLAPDIIKLEEYLSKYQAAKDSLEIYIKIEQLDMDKSALQKEWDKLTGEFEALKKESLLIVEKHEKIGEKEELLSKLITLLAKIDALEEELKNRAKLQSEITSLGKIYRGFERDKEQLEKKLSTVDGELLNLKEKQAALMFKQKIDQIISSVSISSEFVSSEVEFLDSLKPFVFVDKQGAVFERIEELKSLINSKGENSFVFDELKILLDENDKLNGLISNKQAEYNGYKAELTVLLSKIADCAEKGKSVRLDIQSIDAKIASVCGEQDYNEKRKQVEAQIEALKLEISDTKTKFGEYSTLIPKKQSDVETKTREIIFIKQQIDDRAEELSRKLGEMNIEEARAIVEMISAPEEIKSRVEAYKIDKKSLQNEIENLEQSLPSGEYSEEILLELTKERDEIDENTKIFNKKYIEIENNLKIISQKLEKRCIIEKNHKALKDKKALYSSLLEAVRSSKLLEFVADEYLCDVCYDANETLGVLSNGKYGLRYDKEFLVIDYNNAVERKTSTVSGGELFLVSLSLALSLSKSIIAKTNKPIEFFFLDEGFGSLDSALVETVVDSLERLRNESFTIGVISHVEALKERISTKVLVTEPKNGFGSKVKITN